MIFVTVGTYKFDSLIIEVDRLCKNILQDIEVICQIGCGDYTPKNGSKWFRYLPNLGVFIDNADLIIGHGGTGTIISTLTRRKPFIGVVNHELAENHQLDMLKILQDMGYLIFCHNPSELSKKIVSAINAEPRHEFQSSSCKKLTDDLIGFIG